MDIFFSYMYIYLQYLTITTVYLHILHVSYWLGHPWSIATLIWAPVHLKWDPRLMACFLTPTGWHMLVSPRFSWIFPRSWLFGLAPLGPWTRRAATAVGLGAWWSAVLRGGGARALAGGAWKGCATWGGYLGGDQGQLRIWRMSIFQNFRNFPLFTF